MIQRVKEFGFCFGVQAAVDKADAYLNRAEKNIYLHGDLANNQILMDKYKQNGFIVATSLDEIPPNATAIIRAHGIPKKVHEDLQNKQVTIEDCTCPKVKNIHKIVEQRSAQGYRIIIVGTSGHPEVVGTFGWCKEGSAFVAETEADLNAYFADAENTKSPICVVAQTTCKKSWWDAAVNIIAKNPNVEICDTLCAVISRRVTAAVEMAKTSTAMVVVGDEKSANSQELYHSCKAVCENTFFVTGLEDLITLDFEKYLMKPHSNIGLAGSTSAPAEIIEEIDDYLTFFNFLASTKQEVDKNTDDYLRLIIQEAEEKPFIAESLTALYNQNQGGKRIRGAMIKLGATIASKSAALESAKNTANYLSIATAYELFQTAILIHDDIIDKSTTRRGKTTIHAQLSEIKQQGGMHPDLANHFGISQALCIGDYGLFLANRVLAESNLEPHIFAEVFKLFSQIQLTTLEGEIMDVTLPYEPINILNAYERYTSIVNHICEHKTAWYTLTGPIMLGAICGGGNTALSERLRDITLPLGIAFQIKDDLLGIYASEKTIGKDVLSDLIEKKQTLIYGYAYKHATPAQRSQLDTSYGNPSASTEDLETVREIFTATGAQAFAENEIRRLSAVSMQLINDAPFTPHHKSLLKGLVSYQLARRS